MNKIKFLILFSGSLLLSSCNNNLIEENISPDTVIEENVFKTVKNSEKVILGAYLRMPLVSNIYAQSLISDEVRMGPDNNGQGKEAHAWQYTSGTGDVTGVWRGAYSSISNVNKFLLNFDKIEAIAQEDINLKNQLKGEALALRAFNHFLLVRSFSPKYAPNAMGIPYVETDDIFANPSRPTMQETYQKIVADADAAYALLPDMATDNKFRFNKGALRALQAYVALEMNNFDAAVAYADQALAINNSIASTQANVQALWTDTYRDELYFYQANVVGSSVGSPGALYTTNSLASNGLVYFNPSVALFSKFSNTDYRRQRYFSGTPAEFKTFIVNKYPGSSGNYGVNHIKIYRVADMHLVKAEALVRKASPDLAQAYTSYTAVTTARNAGTTTMFTSAADALDRILTERSKEFAFEGSRFFDLKRNGMYVTRSGQDIYPLNPATTLSDINKYTLPIPTSEVQANPNMQQNTGY